MNKDNNLIWIDLEMTGLDPEQEKIIEIGTVVTDMNLEVLAEGPVFAIYQDKKLLDNMDEWNSKQHRSSGLYDRVLASEITEKKAEIETLRFLEKYIPKGLSPMCGNSICLDRRFLYKYMPILADYFHYRNLDVSTLKELVKRWKPQLLKGLKKQSKHLVLEDIKDSIEELRYYRLHFINEVP